MTRQEVLREIEERLERMDTDTLKGLLRLLGHRTEPQLSASGLPYTGDPATDEVLDDPELVERLLEDKKQFEGLGDAERQAKIEEMRKRGELIPWEQVKAELDV